MRKIIGYCVGIVFLILAIVAFAMGGFIKKIGIPVVEAVLQKVLIYDPAPDASNDCGFTTQKDCVKNFCIWKPVSSFCVKPAGPDATGMEYSKFVSSSKYDNFDILYVPRTQTNWWLYDVTNSAAVLRGAIPDVSPVGPLVTYSGSEYVEADWDFEKGSLTYLTRDYSWPADPTDPLWQKSITIFNLGFTKVLEQVYDLTLSALLGAGMSKAVAEPTAHALKGQMLIGNMAAGSYDAIRTTILGNAGLGLTTANVGLCIFNGACGPASIPVQCGQGLMGLSNCLAGGAGQIGGGNMPYGIPSPGGNFSMPQNYDNAGAFTVGIHPNVTGVIESIYGIDKKGMLAALLGAFAGWRLPTGASFETPGAPGTPQVNTLTSPAPGSDGCGLHSSLVALMGAPYASNAGIVAVVKSITCRSAHDLRQYSLFLSWYVTYGGLITNVGAIDNKVAIGLFVTAPTKIFLFTGHTCALATGLNYMSTGEIIPVPPIVNLYGDAFAKATFDVPLAMKLTIDPKTKICGDAKNALCTSGADYWNACYNLRDTTKPVSFQNVAQKLAKCPSLNTFTKVTGKYYKPNKKDDTNKADVVNARLGEILAKNGAATQSLNAQDAPVEGFTGSAFPPGGNGVIFVPGVHGDASERPVWPNSLKVWNDNFGRPMTFEKGSPIPYNWNGYADITVESYVYKGMPRYTTLNGFTGPKNLAGVAGPSPDDASWVPDCMVNLMGQSGSYMAGGNTNFYGCSAAQITAKGYSMPTFSGNNAPTAVPSTDNDKDGVTFQIEPISGKPVYVSVSIGPYLTYKQNPAVYGSVKSTVVPYYGGNAVGGMTSLDKDAVGAGYFLASKGINMLAMIPVIIGVVLLVICVLPCFLCACTAPKNPVVVGNK